MIINNTRLPFHVVYGTDGTNERQRMMLIANDSVGDLHEVTIERFRSNDRPCTKDEIDSYINQFVDYARTNPEVQFEVTFEDMQGYGFSTEDIAWFFRNAMNVSNIELPKNNE